MRRQAIAILLFTLAAAVPGAEIPSVPGVPAVAPFAAPAAPDPITTQTALTVSPLPLLDSPSTDSAATSPTLDTPRHLLSLRVRPMPDALRLILIFDRAAPYTIRHDPARRRAWIDLVNTRLDYIAPELTRLNDARLAGIWVTSLTPAIATLELRFPSAETTLEDFLLDDPPALVIDITRADLAALQGPGAAAPPPAPPALIAAGGAVIPEPWLTAHTDAATTAPVEPPPAAGHASASDAPSTLTIASPEEPAPAEFRPLDADYDWFPLVEIEPRSQLGQTVLDDFLARRWGSVVKDEPGVLGHGLEFLARNPAGAEMVPILYMIAEARYQLGAGLVERPLPDMINFYEQALRTAGGGELGLFAHWRLGHMIQLQGNHEVALEHLRVAMHSERPPVANAAGLEAARVLLDAGEPEAALDVLAKLTPQLADDAGRLRALLLRGRAQVALQRPEEAWQTFREALALDPQWINVERDALEALVEAAIATDRLELARQYIEFLNSSFTFENDERRLRLVLLYADVLARQGDEKTAVSVYNKILARLGDSAKGAEIQRRLYRNYPGDVTAGERNLCRLLFQRGQLVEAMRELDRAWRQCLREGIDVGPLADAARDILPPFMERQQAMGHDYDVMQAWRLYGRVIADSATRRRCWRPLAASLDKLGLTTEALRTIDELLRLGVDSEAEERRLVAAAARLRLEQGDPQSALSDFETLLEQPIDESLRLEVTRNLARAYQLLDRPLEAAQTWQLVASSPYAAPSLVGHALTEAGRIFLDSGMHEQSLELALKGLVYEKQSADAKAPAPWEAAVSLALRLQLARSYEAAGDDARMTIALEDLLARPGLDPSTMAPARLMLAAGRRRLGQPQEALSLYEKVAADRTTPEPWHTFAQVTLRALRWDLTHPAWPIGWGQPAPAP